VAASNRQSLGVEGDADGCIGRHVVGLVHLDDLAFADVSGDDRLIAGEIAGEDLGPAIGREGIDDARILWAEAQDRRWAGARIGRLPLIDRLRTSYV
jgi:hypothetical protein